MKYNYTAIIPARGGSVRLKNKNIINLDGKPLIAYTIEAAQNSGVITKIIVSTDSQDIADIANNYGVKVKKLRPQSLSTSEADIVDVLVHELKSIEQSVGKEDVIALLQPTSPLRTSEDINNAINIFDNSNADTLTSVVNSTEHPYWMWKEKSPYIVPYYDFQHVQMSRQFLPPVYSENGAIYLSKRSLIESNNTIYGSKIIPYIMKHEASVDIDTKEDLAIAQFTISQSKKTL